MWTEHVDATNLECRLWPRGGAIATSLWGLDAPSEEILSPSGKGSVTNADRKFSAASGKAMVLSYVRHRYFLYNRGVGASDLTFHEVDDSFPLRYYRSYIPRAFETEQEIYRYIDNQNTMPISGYKRFDIGSLHLTSQCPPIDKDVFRPLKSEDNGVIPCTQREYVDYEEIKAVQINVADGFPGYRRELMTSWLKQKATDGVHIIGERTISMNYFLQLLLILLKLTTIILN